MTDTPIENKVVEMLDAIQDGVIQLGGMAVKYTPDLVDTVLWVVRIDGISTLLPAIIMFAYSFYTLRKKGPVWWEDATDTAYGEEAPVIFRGLFLAGICVMLFVSSICLLNVWNWVAIIEPKLYIAKELVKAALDQKGK